MFDNMTARWRQSAQSKRAFKKMAFALLRRGSKTGYPRTQFVNAADRPIVPVDLSKTADIA
jgi:hypothetical protein